MRFSSFYQALFGDRVPVGPFRGMRHPVREIGSRKGIGARILGTYECELWPQVEELCKRTHDGIITVGAAEGYYTVGLSQRNPSVTVWAFEADATIRAALVENLQLNGVSERVRVAGLCQVADLSAVLEGLQRPLVIMDVEGAERQLLDPQAIPALRRSEMLVEIHDFADKTVGDDLKARFAETHRIAEVWSRPRTVEDLPPGPMRWLLPLLQDRRVRSLDEGRGCEMRWFFLDPLASA